MEILVRAATPDDAVGIIQVFNPIIEAGIYSAFDTPFTAEEERAFIAGLTKRAIFHVAVQQPDQQIVGFQVVEPFAQYTHAFDHVGTIGTFVDLNCQRQGIATVLFHATFVAARQKGYEKLFALVRHDNQAAIACYLAQGFEPVGIARKHTKINGCYVDEMIIERFLD